jgi:hypothetical protein
MPILANVVDTCDWLNGSMARPWNNGDGNGEMEKLQASKVQEVLPAQVPEHGDKGVMR